MGLAIVLAGKKPKTASGSEMESEESDGKEESEISEGMLAAAHKAKLAIKLGGDAGTQKFAEALLEFIQQCGDM